MLVYGKRTLASIVTVFLVLSTMFLVFDEESFADINKDDYPAATGSEVSGPGLRGLRILRKH